MVKSTNKVKKVYQGNFVPRVYSKLVKIFSKKEILLRKAEQNGTRKSFFSILEAKHLV